MSEIMTWSYRNWTIVSSMEVAKAQALVDAVLAQQLSVVQILKNTSRSVVEQVCWEDHLLVLKHPIEKNHRLGRRIISFFRRYGESKRNILSLYELKKIGIRSNLPWLSMEKKRWGMTTDGFSIYSYVDADACSPKQYATLIGVLKELHQLGFVHGDAHIANFLSYKDQIVLIDCNPKRVWFGNFSYAAEWRYLINSAPDMAPLLSAEISCYSYRFVCIFGYAMDIVKQFKRCIKKYFSRLWCKMVI